MKPATAIAVLPGRIAEKIELADVGCWEWNAGIATNGYGKCWIDGSTRGAHRVVFELLVGPIPNGLYLDHLCRVPACVRPDHLEPVTNHENQVRGFGGINQTAKTHCPQGHPYDDLNTISRPRGSRECRECNRSAAHRRYWARKEAA